MVQALNLAGPSVKVTKFAAEHADCVLRTIFAVGRPEKAVRFYLKEARELPIAHDVAELVLAATANMASKYVTEVLEAVEKHRHGGLNSFTSGMYASALTALGRQHQWALAFGMLHQANSSSKLSQTRHVYHALFPMAVGTGRSELCEQLLDYAKRHEPDCIAAILLRGLCDNPLVVEPLVDKHLLALGATHSAAASSSSSPTWMKACLLFSQKPSSASLDCLVRATAQHTPLIATSLPRFLSSIPVTPKQSERLAATVALHQGALGRQGWVAALGLASALVAKRQFVAVPSLAAVLVRHARWGDALRLLTLSLCNRSSTATSRSSDEVDDWVGPSHQQHPTAHELATCAFASQQVGKWSSALFWVERAHSHSYRFPSALYDELLAGAARRVSWEDTLHAVLSMKEAGGMVSDTGVESLLAACTREDHRAVLFDALQLKTMNR